ncbi:12193_t:CDS:2, partial [Acaulospora morrowiae]
LATGSQLMSHHSILRKVIPKLVRGYSSSTAENRDNNDSIKASNGKAPLKPKRVLAKQYDPAKVEEGWYEWWEHQGFFGTKGVTKEGMDEHSTKTFTMLSPPPNVTGDLHIGHALTFSIQDSLARWFRMRGYS